MTSLDNWIFAALFGMLVLVVALIVGGTIQTSNQRAAFAEKCYAVGGTPIHTDSDSYCVAQFADMRNRP